MGCRCGSLVLAGGREAQVHYHGSSDLWFHVGESASSWPQYRRLLDQQGGGDIGRGAGVVWTCDRSKNGRGNHGV